MSTIVHLTAPAQFGGLERVLLGLASGTAQRGYRVVVFMSLSPCTPVPSWAESLMEAGVIIEPEYVGDRAYLAERRLVRRLLQRERPSVVHTHGYRSDVLHRGIARRLGIPAVSTAHGFSGKPGGLVLNERLQVWAWRRFDRVVAVSTPLREHLRALGVPAQRLTYIRNGLVPPANFRTRSEARAALDLPGSAFVAGWIGRLSPEKDPVLAVEAFAAFGDASATLCLVGDGPERTACESRAVALGVRDRMRFAGPQTDAACLLPAFDVLMLSSRTEGTPMTILEAAIAGVPIVATQVGGVPNIVGAEGWLSPAMDANAMAESLRGVASQRDLALERAERLRARLLDEDARADWVGQYLALYAELSGSPSGTTSPAPSSP